MICKNCQFVEKEIKTDGYGNIHVYWYCSKTTWLLFHRVTYTDHFLIDLRSGSVFKGDVILRAIIPLNKPINEIQQTETLFMRKVVNCTKYRLKSADLSRYF